MKRFAHLMGHIAVGVASAGLTAAPMITPLLPPPFNLIAAAVTLTAGSAALHKRSNAAIEQSEQSKKRAIEARGYLERE